MIESPQKLPLDFGEIWWIKWPYISVLFEFLFT